MQIKKHGDLLLSDLPRIESPYNAASIFNQQADRLSSSLRWQPDDILNSAVGCPVSRHEAIPLVIKKLRDGELLLVLGATDGKPFDPVIGWKESTQLPGRWVLNTPIFGQNLEHQVAQLNDWQITPEQINTLGPGGVGSLEASSFDMRLRARQNREREQVNQDSDSNLTLPLGAAAAVAPLAAHVAATPTKENKPEKALHFEVGLFLDGTLNNAGNIEIFNEQVEKTCLAPRRRGEIDDEECEARLALMMGASYGNGETNVSKLFDLYQERKLDDELKSVRSFRVYSPGAGTTTGNGDSLISSATGLGDAGILRQVENAFEDAGRRIGGILSGEKHIDELTIDIWGFSRGAAAARHAASEISRGNSGLLGQLFAKYDVKWPKQVVIRFIGLFDTVAGIVNLKRGDFSVSDERTAPVNIYLNPEKVKTAVHITAADECRSNFSLNSLRRSDGSVPRNFTEFELPGAHSDIGGGYQDEDIERVQLARTLSISDSRTPWPEETMEWDNLKAIMDETTSEGWIGQSSISPTGDIPHLGINTAFRTHPAPYGRVDLSLEMVRQIRGEYSNVALKLMHSQALEAKVPLERIEVLKQRVMLPDDLVPIADSLLEQLHTKKENPVLSDSQLALLKQRYVHHSDNYNSIELLVRDTIIDIEIPWAPLMPMKPAKKRERIIHPNVPEAS